MTIYQRGLLKSLKLYKRGQTGVCLNTNFQLGDIPKRVETLYSFKNPISNGRRVAHLEKVGIAELGE